MHMIDTHAVMQYREWLRSDSSKFSTAIKSRMMQLAHFVFLVLSPINDVAACRVVNYHHVFWVEREHFVVLNV